MAKRFHDTDIWDEDWFIALPKDYRDFYLFIKDKCDHAGIYKPNIAKFNKLYDCNINTKKAIELINKDGDLKNKERIIVLNNGRWFLPDFICFQYGNNLNLNNRVHASALKVLETNGVKLDSIRGLIEVKHRLKDKDKDKDKDNSKGVIRGKEARDKFFNNIPKDLLEDLKKDYPNINTTQELKNAENWLKDNPRRQKKNLRQFVRNWFKNADKYKKQDNQKAQDYRKYKNLIESNLNGLATTPIIISVMKQIPEDKWYLIDDFLKKRYPGSPGAFDKAEKEYIAKQKG